MSNASKAPALPPFFRNISPLDQVQHANLKLDREAGYGFARNGNAVPLAIGEFFAAAQHYPIVFSDSDQPLPVAVVGYRNGENVYVDADGKWEAARYVPAYLRCYPFILVAPDETKEERIAALDIDHEGLSETRGDALMAEGKPTAMLRERLQLCEELRGSLAESARFVKAAKEAGLLRPRTAQLEFANGQKARLDGFLDLDPPTLQALPDATVVEWHRNGWLAAAQAMVFSATQWGRLIDQVVTRQKAA